ARLLAKLPEVHFLIVGNGTTRATLERQAAEMGLTNVRFLPFQPRERVPEMYAAADVSLVLLKQGIGADSVPSKAYTILASGRPLIASVDPDAETTRLVEESGCGVATPPQNPTALAEAIRRLYADPAARAEMGQRGREYVTARYAPVRVAEEYESLFRDVVEAHRQSARAPRHRERPPRGGGR
ncbi:MAG: glycosyltransferase family 4 protein, partial [Armatimonadota bacterium]|nr:glycosyltransferase family 4 protein [Armatimonadota bacterium]